MLFNVKGKATMWHTPLVGYDDLASYMWTTFFLELKILSLESFLSSLTGTRISLSNLNSLVQLQCRHWNGKSYTRLVLERTRNWAMHFGMPRQHWRCLSLGVCGPGIPLVQVHTPHNIHFFSNSLHNFITWFFKFPLLANLSR
jgi:hypothetical protein